MNSDTSKTLISREGSKESTTLDCLTLLSYHEAPTYLQFNPYILSGYRGYLSTKMCFERLVEFLNELFGFRKPYLDDLFKPEYLIHL